MVTSKMELAMRFVLFTGDELWEHKRQEKHGCFTYMYKPHLCDLCGKSLKTLMSFKEHKLGCEASMEGSYKFTCEHCGAQFKTKTNYQNHVRNVHVRCPMTCHICGQSCKNARSLQEHKRRHNEANRKHACKDCDKTFFSKSLLTAHVRTHTKEKPFKCAFCSYGCAVKQNLMKHAKKRHKHLSEKACKDYTIIMKPLNSNSVDMDIPSTEPMESSSQRTLDTTEEDQNILPAQNDSSFQTPDTDQDRPSNIQHTEEVQSRPMITTHYPISTPHQVAYESNLIEPISAANDVTGLVPSYPLLYVNNPYNVRTDLYNLSSPSDPVPGNQSQSMLADIWESGKPRAFSPDSQQNTEVDLRIGRDYYQESQYVTKPTHLSESPTTLEVPKPKQVD